MGGSKTVVFWGSNDKAFLHNHKDCKDCNYKSDSQDLNMSLTRGLTSA